MDTLSINNKIFCSYMPKSFYINILINLITLIIHSNNNKNNNINIIKIIIIIIIMKNPIISKSI